MQGFLAKMKTTLNGKSVEYELPLSEELIPMNQYVGKPISLEWLGNIKCVGCGEPTKKSFQQGYCFMCTRRLAQCDMCILKPEQCHHHLGTCREPEWGDKHCMQDHIVYLANSSGLKVGITRIQNVPSRWMDQGAIQALPILQVSTRRLSGLVEVAIAKHVSDKTNWRAMLKNEVVPIGLQAKREELLDMCASEIDEVSQMDIGFIQEIARPEVVELEYPVLQYPTKIASHNFDKNLLVSGTLLGIKAQYLIFDTGVINIRKFGGYEVGLKV